MLFSLLGSAQSISKIPTAITSNSIPQPINGALQGKVSDETGKSVSGAVITFRHFFTVQGRNQRVTTKNDGTFTINELPSGDYSQCIQVPNSDYVDDCEWNLTFVPRVLATPSPTQIGAVAMVKPVFAGDMPHSSERIVVPPAGLSSPQQLRVRKGARVTVRFVDLAKVIDDKSHLMVGALSPIGMFISATRATAGSVTTFEQVIPFDTKVRLIVNSLALKATGPKGVTDLAAGGTTEVKVGPKDPPLVFNYTITGKTN